MQKVGQMSMWLVVNSTMSAVLIYEPPQTARPPGNRIRLGTPMSWFGGWHWELESGGWGGVPKSMTELLGWSSVHTRWVWKGTNMSTNVDR